jgi:hypothetical protein
LTYKWTVPATLDTEPTYHLQLSTNASETIHYSGAFKVAHTTHSGMTGTSIFREGGCSSGLALVGVVAVGVLVVINLVAGAVRNRKDQSTHEYEYLDDKSNKQQV